MKHLDPRRARRPSQPPSSAICCLAGCAWCIAATAPAPGQCYTLTLPQVGEREFCLPQADPTGLLVAPAPPSVAPFRPPSIFSAPLPSGSGARAAGVGGAFTAVADDATAASWNPAGLARLERPEASVVFRFDRETDRHRAGDPALQVGGDEFDNENLNYFSLVYPFGPRLFGRNVVASLNYQEAYDFTQRFSATFRDQRRSGAGSSATRVDSPVSRFEITDGLTPPQAEYELAIRARRTTATAFDQRLTGDLLAEVDFDQQGIIDAWTPAFAVAVTPTLFMGASINFYQDSPLSGRSIRSRTRAVYEGASTSSVRSRSETFVEGTYSFEGVLHLPGQAGFPPSDVPVSGSGDLEPVTEVSVSNRTDRLVFDGIFEETSTVEDLSGVNATLGVLWTVSRHLTLGATLDLPWRADGRQRTIAHQQVTTYDESRTRVVDVTETLQDQTKDIEFEFPLYWSAGALYRWTPHLYTSLDVSQTRWSAFSFRAEGEERINPLDGSPHRENPLDDTWSVRAGVEYLIVGRRTEIPLRAGVAYEQRPALDEPDDFLSYSVGTGIALGRDPGRTILDVAYVFTHGDDVRGVIPEQEDLRSDVKEHRIVVSLIQHF